MKPLHNRKDSISGSRRYANFRNERAESHPMLMNQATGMVNLKVLPFPSPSLSTHILPP
jgi:hypothetical protein